MIIRGTVERTILERFYLNVPDDWHHWSREEQEEYVTAAHAEGDAHDAEEMHGVSTDYSTLKF